MTRVDVTRPGSLPPRVLVDGLELRVFVRRPDSGTVTVTVSLVNVHASDAEQLQDARCFFQAGLRVYGSDGTRPIVERRVRGVVVDPEQALSRLLYRHAPSFAVGHGCAVEWDWSPVPVGRQVPLEAATVSEVRTTFFPTHEVRLTDSNPDIDDRALGMWSLSTEPTSEVLGALDRLLDGYRSWIEEQSSSVDLLRGTEHEVAAREQIRLMTAAHERMRGGVALLRRDQQALEAFRLANRAMAIQRSRATWVRSGRSGKPLTDGRWRPFQISFMLLCLDGIADPAHADRGVADLLWFPTGGGKTEAYLGLIAFTVFLRRLRLGAHGGGVTVLMRYTLRLLTLQQFERAAALVCSMEEIRRSDESSLGSEEISIGMWVGSSATPNKLSDADKALRELRGGKAVREKNPVQLRACPWCGTALDAHAYAVDAAASRMVVCCPAEDCAFHRGLPVHVVDEAVYAARPTLVIATVDKFAALPWRPETLALFNRDREDDTPPPELIVQDELHLISGPLGTLTGLYETAIDMAAGRPKVIASTATIRRAASQGAALFRREVSQFPPAGLDARDSWFAVEAAPETKATRRYVGLLAGGTSQATLLVRTYAALLHHAHTSPADAATRDAYWTLVGYFNSLRLLAAADLQVHDDVQDRLEFLARRDGVDGRKVLHATELTSRATADEVPRCLKHMELALPHPEVLDVLLATNMISVGVDVDRLGLMAVMGQPQTTAEYIQATSRVGRRHAGLVVTMLNSARSRDRSHYENFLGFHSALYREVESTSVTPFSARSRDRGLHAVFVALARMFVPEARANDAAGRVEEYVDDLLGIRDAIVDRAAAVDPDERVATQLALDEILAWWRDLAEDQPSLLYEAPHGSGRPALLGTFDETESSAIPTMWSLRDVDSESSLFLER